MCLIWSPKNTVPFKFVFVYVFVFTFVFCGIERMALCGKKVFFLYCIVFVYLCLTQCDEYVRGGIKKLAFIGKMPKRGAVGVSSMSKLP